MFAIQKPQLSADGRWAAISSLSGLTEAGGAGDGENAVSVWALAKGEFALHIPFDVLPGVYEFSPDGGLLATSDVDGTVRLWDLERGEELFRWKAADRAVDRLLFSPDGSALAASPDMGTELRLLHLAGLRGPLAERGLDWGE
jgi:WD40 repeat protein